MSCPLSVRFVLLDGFEGTVRPDDVTESLLKVPHLDREHICCVTQTIHNRYQVTFTSIEAKQLVMTAGLEIEGRLISVIPCELDSCHVTSVVKLRHRRKRASTHLRINQRLRPEQKPSRCQT